VGGDVAGGCVVGGTEARRFGGTVVAEEVGADVLADIGTDAGIKPGTTTGTTMVD
jgi:hypothetical protein